MSWMDNGPFDSGEDMFEQRIQSLSMELRSAVAAIEECLQELRQSPDVVSRDGGVFGTPAALDEYISNEWTDLLTVAGTVVAGSTESGAQTFVSMFRCNYTSRFFFVAQASFSCSTVPFAFNTGCAQCLSSLHVSPPYQRALRLVALNGSARQSRRSSHPSPTPLSPLRGARER